MIGTYKSFMSVYFDIINISNFTINEIYKLYKSYFIKDNFKLLSFNEFENIFLKDFKKINGKYKFINDKIYNKYDNMIDRKTEKNTEYFMQTVFKKHTGKIYNTAKSDIFDNLLPDGYATHNNNFYIIENKKSDNLLDQGIDQLRKYIEILKKKIGNHINIIGIIGVGCTKDTFKYYGFDSNMNPKKNIW